MVIDCPRCHGTLLRAGLEIFCLACGWDGWPRPEAVALREQLLDRPERRLARQGGRARE
jgi:hypothetical protein